MKCPTDVNSLAEWFFMNGNWFCVAVAVVAITACLILVWANDVLQGELDEMWQELAAYKRGDHGRGV